MTEASVTRSSPPPCGLDAREEVEDAESREGTTDRRADGTLAFRRRVARGRLPWADEQPAGGPSGRAAQARGEADRGEEHAHPAGCRSGGIRRAARPARRADRDRVRRGRGKPGGGGEGAQRRSQGHEDPDAARRGAVGQPDQRRGDRAARQAAAARGPAGSTRRRHRRAADPARSGAERTVAEPRRLDQRQDRTAGRRRDGRTGRADRRAAGRRGRGRSGSRRGGSGRGGSGPGCSRSPPPWPTSPKRIRQRRHRRRSGGAELRRPSTTTHARGSETRWQRIRQRCSRHSAR